MKLETLNFNRKDGHYVEFEIINISAAAMPAIPESFHRHNFYEILFVEKYNSKQIVDFKNYVIDENELLIIPKNSVHHTVESKGYKGLWFLFTDAFFTEAQNKTIGLLSIFNPIIDNKLIKLNPHAEVLKYIELLKLEYFNNDINIVLLQNLLFTFLIKLENIAQKQYEKNAISLSQNYYLSFINLLENNFKQQHAIGFYTNSLIITPKKLNLILVNIVGKTIGELIIERVIIEAKRLLAYTDLSAKEIAYELGFEDSHYFSRIFKKKTTLSPELFRYSIAEKSTKKK
jgi:AraC family transcriptional regulator, transcriptional activator of pobA